MLAETHEHHAHSANLMMGAARGVEYAVAAHTYAEAYSTLTRRGEHAPFGFSPNEAWAALQSVRAVTALVGLTPAQTFDAVRSCAQAGGVGPRLYDLLIGQTAAIHKIPVIVTWNVRHMRSLFPTLTVVTPETFGKRSATK